MVWETAIPEDWPEGQASHIIFTFEAFSADGGALTFALKETDDTAKFSLIPAGVNDAGNYLAQLQLKAGEELDYRDAGYLPDWRGGVDGGRGIHGDAAAAEDNRCR